MSGFVWPHGLQHIRLPCTSPSPRACSNLCPSSWSCHPTISSSVVPFSSWLQSFPASGSFPVSQFFASGGQSYRSFSFNISPSMNIQDWFSLRWKLVVSPSLSKEIQSVHPKVNHSWIFIGRTDAETPILWPPDAKNQLIGKDPDAGKNWRDRKSVV